MRKFYFINIFMNYIINGPPVLFHFYLSTQPITNPLYGIYNCSVGKDISFDDCSKN